MAKKINSKFAISTDASGNVTGWAYSPVGEIEFFSDTDVIYGYDNEEDFKAAKAPINPVAFVPKDKITARGLAKGRKV